MFLQWVAKCELVPLSADSYVLKKFSDKCQRGMCGMVVTFLSGDSVDLADVLPSGHHIRWSMEVIGHSFALGMEDADVIAGALKIYEKWLGVEAVNLSATNGNKPKDQRPACMQKVEQSFIQDMLGQMTLLFEERTDAASRSSDALVAKHVSLCIKVLDVFDALVKRRGSALSPQTWERIIRLLLGAADGVLHGSKGALGNHLCGQLTRILFEVYLRSLPFCGPKIDMWSLLQKFCRRWIHRILVIEQWNAATLALTKSLMKQIHAPDASKEIEIIWAENRVQSKFELESSQLAYAWHRLIRVIGHPSSISDPDVYLAAIKGISRLADEFTRIEQLPKVKWSQVLGALNSAPTRDNSIFAAVTNGGAEDDAIVKEVANGMQPRSPPDVNTILRLLGPWLFDASLTRKSRFDAGRSEALRCLGKLLCQVSGGRSKKINWAYGIRSLMALQNALLDEDERISASAVFNWSKVFGLYGNHTLRGVGVITGSFHKAVERILRTTERTEMTTSPKLADSARRGTDPFYTQDEHSVGGIPVVLLRRAAIEACSSLLTLHAHLPRHFVKEAEKQIVMSSMLGIPGLYSSLPKYTSSNVVALLMHAIKSETDPTNHQMMMWLLTVAIQQEASYWASGLASSKTSQVPVTILLICTIVSKSGRYKPQVLFTAFDCLRHLSLVYEELFVHAASSVVHVVNTCCDFITNSAPILRSSRAPFYLDSLMAAAYYCIIEWIVAAPLLLSKPQVISKIIATVVDGNDRIQSFTSKNTAVAVREAAQKLVNMLMKHHVAQTASGMNSRSSVLNEKSVLAELCGEESADVNSHCRFFSINKSSILTVIEKPDSAPGPGEAIMIMRDSTGRYVWRSRPRYCDGPRPKTLEEFEEYVELSNVESDTEEADSDDDGDEQETERDRVPSGSDPLLQAIRDTQSKTTMMSWRAGISTTAGGGAAGIDADSSKVLFGEGNSGMSSLIERRAMAAGRDEGRETQDAIFMDLLNYQSREDKESNPSTGLNLIRCAKPTAPVKDKNLRSWETARRMMTELGFLSVRNWGSVFAMDASTGELLQDLESLDKLPDRETFEIAVAYATSLSSKGGYDNVHIASSSDVISGDVTLSSDYKLFLGALGERVDAENHIGYIGSLDTERTNGKMLYHSHYSHETCFYVPTMPLESKRGAAPEETSQESLSLLERSNVMILWNECQQKYRPGSMLWDTVFNLPTPTSRVIIIIDPLDNDLYCVHISHESSPLFNQRDVITNEEDNCVDDGEVYCSRVLGPIQDGMVVNGAWLAPLVRQTAINAAMLSRSFHRYQYDIGAIATSPVGPEANRAEVIASVVEKHMRPKLPGDFYGGLFTDSMDSNNHRRA